jgi:formate C-acetyltransferase
MEGTAFVSNNIDNDRYWRGFRQGDWCHSIAARDFIVRNVSPYAGDETFLAGPSKRTKAV